MHPDHHEIFDEIGRLNTSPNTPRDQQIAARLTQLYQEASAAGDMLPILAIRRCVDFLLQHPDYPLPSVTLLPNGTRLLWDRPLGENAEWRFLQDIGA